MQFEKHQVYGKSLDNLQWLHYVFYHLKKSAPAVNTSLLISLTPPRAQVGFAKNFDTGQKKVVFNNKQLFKHFENFQIHC